MDTKERNELLAKSPHEQHLTEALRIPVTMAKFLVSARWDGVALLCAFAADSAHGHVKFDDLSREDYAPAVTLTGPIDEVEMLAEAMVQFDSDLSTTLDANRRARRDADEVARDRAEEHAESEREWQRAEGWR